jgi:hypothetical protein
VNERACIGDGQLVLLNLLFKFKDINGFWAFFLPSVDAMLNRGSAYAMPHGRKVLPSLGGH